MSRGNNGQEIFLMDKGRRLFLATLKEVCLQTGWKIHAYVLMSNHYHLLLETPEPNLVAGMKWFQGTYTQRFNAMFDRRGHLFQGRYKALPVETSHEGYFKEVGQYIHLNPFRAKVAGNGMDMDLEEYFWSSYRYYIHPVNDKPEWLSVERLYAASGINVNEPEYASRYQSVIQSRMFGECGDMSSEERLLAENHLQRGWYIGSESFGKSLVSGILHPSDNLRGEQRRMHGESEAERLIMAALSSLNISADELLKAKSNSLDKQSVAWLLKTHTTVTGVWIAARLNMGHRMNVSRAITIFNRSAEKSVQKMREKMLQCSG
jgi:REP element-mobilizing transposase RayT